MDSSTNSATCSLGVSSELPARGTGGTAVCHIQVDHTSPASCASTCVWSKDVGNIPLNTLQLVCEVVLQVLIELQAFL